ncbi:MAG: hypothetical protein ACI87E_002929 [Mariniblastus sp.]|jgi:hypothetical protein
MTFRFNNQKHQPPRILTRCRPLSRRDRDGKANGQSRTGSASMDYVLVLAVILPLATFLFLVVPRMISLVYEMTITIVGSPLM